MSEQFEQLGSNTGEPAGDAGAGNGGAGGTVEWPIKRSRGRPRKSAVPPAIDPASIGTGAGGSGDSGAGSDTGGTERAGGKRRGRRPKAQAVPVSVETLIVGLAAMQLTAFKLTEVPEVVLSGDQNKALAEALANVARHYPVAISQKTADIIALGVVGGNIGMTQFALYHRRKSQEAATGAATTGGFQQ